MDRVPNLIFVFLVVPLMEIVFSGGPSSRYGVYSTTTDNFCITTIDFVEEAVYQGSACFVDLYLTWNEAFEFCGQEEMQLLIVTNNLRLNVLLQTAEKIYGQRIGETEFLWVNAKRNSDNFWISYDNQTERIMRDYFRLQWASRAAQTSGDCLSLSNLVGPFKAAANNCEEIAPFLCFYKKNETVSS